MYVSTTNIVGWDTAKSKIKAATIPTLHFRALCVRDDWDSISASLDTRWVTSCASWDARRDSWAGCSDWDPDGVLRSEASCLTSSASWDNWAGGSESDGPGCSRSEASCASSSASCLPSSPSWDSWAGCLGCDGAGCSDWDPDWRSASCERWDAIRASWNASCDASSAR